MYKVPGAFSDLEEEDLTEDYRLLPRRDQDVAIIAVLGLTGAGKSSFIKAVTGRQDIKVGHGLCAETSEVQSYRLEIDPLVIEVVDTPGFNDTYESDKTIAERLAAWLSKTYRAGRLLNGIIYLHPIDSPKMSGSSMRSKETLQKFCGENALNKLVIVTTFWDLIPTELGEAREREMLREHDFFGGLLKHGAKLERMPTSVADKRALLQSLAVNQGSVLEIQSEMVDLGRTFQKTTVSAELSGAVSNSQLRLAAEVTANREEMATRLAASNAKHQAQLEESHATHRKDLLKQESRFRKDIEFLRQSQTRLSEQQNLTHSMALEAKKNRCERLQKEVAALVRAREDEKLVLQQIQRQAEDEMQRVRNLSAKRCQLMQDERDEQQRCAELLRMQKRSLYINQALLRSLMSLIPLFEKKIEVVMRITFCDWCLVDILKTGTAYYVCEKCRDLVQTRVTVCSRCWRSGKRCFGDASHTPVRKTLTHEGETRCGYHNRESLKGWFCNGCRSTLKGYFLHCHQCSNDQYDLCIQCFLQKPFCSKEGHTISIALTMTNGMPDVFFDDGDGRFAITL